jgi:hypothetical protein
MKPIGFQRTDFRYWVGFGLSFTRFGFKRAFSRVKRGTGYGFKV